MIARQNDPTDADGADGAEQSVADLAMDYVQEGIDDGLELSVAAAVAARRLIAEGLGADVLELVGARALADLWRSAQRHARHAINQSLDALAGTPLAASVEGAGERRVDVALLRRRTSLLEVWHCVDGTWKRLGDLTRDDAAWLERDRASLAIGVLRERRFFRAVKRELAEGQTVRERFSEDDLRALKASVAQPK